MRPYSGRIARCCQKWLAFGLVAVMLATPNGWALPTGWQVVEGNVSFEQQGNILNVISQSDRAVVNYITFNLANGETINFILPNATSSILNQVIGGQASHIAGSINSNGIVGIVNPAGINIANTAQIKTAMLLISTLNVNDFSNGAISLSKNGDGAAVVNEGVIEVARGGQALIAASGIVNRGEIIAVDGSIHLAVGDKVTFHLTNNSAVEVTIDEGVKQIVDGLNAAITNEGAIAAHTVELKTKLNDNLVANAINNDGLIHGVAMANEGGQIRIEGEGGGAIVSNTGLLYAGATGQSAKAGDIRIRGDVNYNAGAVVAISGEGEKGGTVHMLGETVINEGGYIDVSGDKGGGVALIGGDYQGKNTDVENAKLNMADQNTVVVADAYSEGDGGKVVFWSDENTVFHGQIFSRGGVESGNGGFAEVSGHEYLDMQGWADLTAPNGIKGDLLLDPNNINIISFTPTDLGSDLELWLDASDLSTITKNGSNLVSQWNDKSGNGNNATAGGGSRPTYDVNDLNGLPTIIFNNGQTMSSGLHLGDLGNQNTTFLVNQNVGAPDSYDGMLFWRGTGANASGLGIRSTAQWGYHWNDTAATYNWASGFNINTNPHVISLTISPTSGTLGVDSATSTNNTANAAINNNTVDLTIGQDPAGGRFYSGRMSEIIVVSDDLSTVDRQTVEQYLNAKWGLNVSTANLNTYYLGNANSVLVDTYLEALSQSSNISLLATNNITVGNLTDNMLSLGNHSLTMTATNGNIIFNDINDTIRTEGQNISLTAGGTMTLGNLNTTGAAGNLNTGNITLNAGGNITASSLDVNTGTINVTTSGGGSFGTSGTPITTDAANITLNTAGNTYINNARAVTATGSTGGNLQLRQTATGNITVNNMDVTGTADIQTFANSNSDISGTGNIFRGTTTIATNDSSGGDITFNTGTNDFRGNTTLTGDYIRVTDTSGDFTVSTLSTGATGNVNDLRANAGNLTIGSAAGTIALDGGAAGALDARASGNVTIDGGTAGYTATGDTINAWSTGGGTMTLANITLGNSDDFLGDVGNSDPGGGVGIRYRTTGGYVFTNNNFSTANNTVTVDATGSITGTGNTFTGATDFDANQGTAYDISLTNSNFVSGTNNFDGRNVTVGDTAGGLTVSNITATGTGTVTSSGGDLNITLADIASTTTLTSSANLTASGNNNFGTITASANGDLTLYELGTMNVNSITNTGAGATSDTYLVSLGGSIQGKSNTTADVTTNGTGETLFVAGLTAANTTSNIDLNLNNAGNVIALATGREAGTNNAIELRGNVNGNLEAMGWDAGTFARGSAVGNIVLGDATEGLAVTGTTQTRTSNTYDITGIGSFGNTVAATGGRVGLAVTSGNFTAGNVNSITAVGGLISGSALSGITAGNATGWAGDESLIINTTSGDILGTGYTTSGAANIRLQAGTTSSLLATNNINVNNVTAGQDLALYATGDSAGTGNGTAIQVGGTSTVAGTITASGFNASNYFDATNGAVNITLSSGDLETALVWTNNDNITLTTTNGGIIQNFAKYGYNGKTIYTTGGDVTLTANGGSGYINTGVNALGTGSDLTARAGGQNGGLSVQLYGRVDGNLTVHNTSGAGNAVTGGVNLGTSLGGSITDLDDTYTVQDVLGTTSIRATGDVNMYGMFIGTVNIYSANDVTIDTDKGSVTLGQLTSSGDVDVTSRRKSIIATTIQAMSGSVNLSAGTSLPNDKFSNIQVSNISTSGNLNAEAWGTSNGTTSGNAIVVSGSVGGVSNTTTHSGGVVSVP